MADFFALSPEDKLDALGIASTQSGRPVHLLEKDVWVVWALQKLFASKFAEHLVFKGGTSLSKAYGAIQRFSEDVDITYDIRVIAADLVKDAPDALPASRSQQNRWTKDIRARLAKWVEAEMLPYIESELVKTDETATASADGDTITITYKAASKGTGYVGPTIKIEFGARSTGQPAQNCKIVCDAAPYLDAVTFPECTVQVMLAERTFWEKATAIHVYCKQGELAGDRFSRHWYDLYELDKAGIVTRALNNRDLAKQVAEHKQMFFREKAADGAVINYGDAVSGTLVLVPSGAAREALATDYAKMIEDGLLPSDAPTFDAILNNCADIEKRANS